MENFPSNNNAGKPAKDGPKIEQVVTGKVIQRKKPLGKRFAETFVGGDAKGTWSYVLMDVMIPAAKDMLSDAVSQGVERMLFGETRPRGRGRPGVWGSAGYQAYNRATGGRPGGPPQQNQRMSNRARGRHDFGEIVLESRSEANDVLDQLYTLLSQYNVAKVADLYEMVGITANYTDNKWGWTSLQGSQVVRVNNGYLIDLPPTEPLD